MAILWNLDSGVVVFGAILVALAISTLDAPDLKDSIRRSIVYACWMFGAFVAVLLTFMVSTRVHSGAWPDFNMFVKFQNIFYVSGFSMLAMSPVHFWNLPVVVYLVTCIYCVYHLKKTYQQDLPAIVFLFILGGGAFAYFQGRSYDTTVMIVMYPAIILAGIFCSKLLSAISTANPSSLKVRFHESMVMVLIPLFFLSEGAFSMLWQMPAIHSYSMANAKKEDTAKDHNLLEKIANVTASIPKKDTVFILSRDFESYYYAAGNYYNPLNQSGSTEIFLWSELANPLYFIKSTKYPIVFDASHQWLLPDTFIKTLAEYTIVEKMLGTDSNLLLLKPRSKRAAKLAPSANTLYYYDLGYFGKFSNFPGDVVLPANYSIEFYATLDSSKLSAGNIMFTDALNNAPNRGVVMMQNGNDLTQYMFFYGNGAQWSSPAIIKLSCSHENHVLIQVRNNMVTAFNNGVPVSTVNTGTSLKNSEGKFKINQAFSGIVDEFMISTP